MIEQDALQRADEAQRTVKRSEIVSRYKRLRSAGQILSSKLVRRLSKDVLDEGARKLGLLRDGIMVFDTEDQAAVLMDYCIHDVRRNGRNAAEQYLIDSPPDPESDEMDFLRAMQHARYSLFIVEWAEPGLGIGARDLLRDDNVLIVDMGFGSSGKPGLVFASRLLFHDGFSMSTGAALPIGIVPANERDILVKELSAVTAVDKDGCFDPASLTRTCLRNGSSSHVRYEDAPGASARTRRPHALERRVSAIASQSFAEVGRSAKVGRNAPCPCGSGKKFKHCCLNRG
jgi:hypothetical protein